MLFLNSYPYYQFCRQLAGVLLSRGKRWAIFMLLWMITSCQNEVELNIPGVRQEIVVDGWIENGNYPFVILTASSQYYSIVDSTTLRKLVLSQAKVTVSNGTQSDILTLFVNNDYFPPYVYRGTTFRGEVGKTYYLTVEYGGRVVTAKTTIPKPVVFDSLRFQLNQGSDSLGIIKGIIYDNNPNEANFYRVFYQVRGKNKKFYPTLVSFFDDKYFVGGKLNLNLYKGNESYLKPNSNFYFNLLDTVFIKVTSIDENSHKFWKSYEEEIVNAPNPFASAHKEVLSNVKGGLGIWCGYGASYYAIIAKQ